MINSYREQNKADKFFLLIMYVMLTYIFLITPIIQLQMHVLGEVVIKGIHFNILLCVMLLIYIVSYLVSGKKIILDKIGVISLVFGSYVFLDMIFVKVRLNYSFSYLAYAINSELFIFLTCLLLLFPPMIKVSNFKKISLYAFFMFIVNILMTFAQHFSNSLLYKFYNDNNGDALLQTDGFTRDTVRAIGTFSSGLKLGIFFSFIIIILTTYLLYNFKQINNKKRFLVGLFIVIGTMVVYISYTRNIYFLLCYMIIFLLAIKFLKGKIKLSCIYLYPIITPIIYFVGTVIIIPTVFSRFSSSLFSPQNLLARLNFWKHHMLAFKEWSSLDKIFGKSIIQISNPKAMTYGVQEVIFDNMYLNMFAFLGMIGLVIFLSFLYSIYINLIKKGKNNYLVIAISIFSSGLLFMGTLNNTEDIYEILGVFLPALILRMYLYKDDMKIDKGKVKKKINILIPFTRLTGGIKVLFEYANGLTDLGYDVVFYVPMFAYRFKEKSIKSEVERIRNSLGNIKRNNKVNWMEINFDIKLVPLISNRFIRNADVSIATAWPTAYSLDKLNSTKGEKVYFIQGYEVWNGNEERVKDSYRLNINKITISTFIKETIKENTNVEIPTILPNGINLNDFYCNDKAFNENLELLIMYNNDKHKGFKDGMDAYNIAKAKYPNIKIRVFGVKKDSGLPENLEFYENPSKKELRNLFSKSDIYIFPSRVEGFGLTPLEALACKTPVVATSVGCILDFGINKKNIMINAPGDINDMAKNIIYLIEHRELLKGISESGHEVVKEYSWDKSLKKLDFYLKNLIEK
ncbi:glycosyltransferase family 4 protein [Clostridium tertium]|uniref:glycosyltransferase family 4 protein n=1 Tax=Clostridium tertium TaxID=1559 RepID=UPI00232D8C98|nr:glycosyltransferase family 4 protein [Clostridium tertium]MDB1921704.1 glycosyltransferase family 4 protein [Clostridium tertium]MDB1924907.1 glycosyltransferase family 4 protein [Clostridium tertium]MDB1929546.1 glycosyltransferase family 4 protein [Clostridium tertium]